MLNATEVFRQLDAALQTREGGVHSFSDTLSQQLQLAEQVQSLMTEAQQCISVPEYLLGDLQFSDRVRPHSSTGEILYVEQPGGERLALKLLRKLGDDGEFRESRDIIYAFHYPEVRLMTAVGESLMGKAANMSVPIPMYYGVGGVTGLGAEGVSLQPFDVEQILSGNMEPVIVMRAMSSSMSEVLLDTVDARNRNEAAPYSAEQLSTWTDQVFHKVLNASVPLSDELAAKIGSPAEIQNLMVGKTVGWLAGRDQDPEVLKHPALVNAVKQAQEAQRLFAKFFAMPETQVNLAARAVPQLKDSVPSPLGKLAQTFSPGDTKFSNVMIGSNGHGTETVGLFDPQWLILNPGAQGNEGHAFAPWPFADLMQILAYTAAEPASYGFPDLQKSIYDGVRNYYGEDHWSEWHELYLRLLTSYKMLVDVAVNVDSYIQKKASHQQIPRALNWTIERHPSTATELAQDALRVYDQKKHR